MEETIATAQSAATIIRRPLALRHPQRVLGMGLLVGALFDLLFWGHRLGISVPLFFLGWVAALVATGRFEDRPARRAALWLLPPLLSCALFMAVRANGFLTSLNGLTALGLLVLFIFFYAAGDWRRAPGLILALIPGWVALNAALDAGRLLFGVQWPTPSRRRWAPLIRGLVLTLPLLLLFGAILAAGDQIFAAWLARLLGWLRLEKLVELWIRLLIIGFVGLSTGGALIFSMRRGAEPERSDRLPVALNVGLGYVETVTILVGVNLLFGLFVMIQFAYLFGGTANIAPEQFSYAEYARRGFAEIVIVAVLSLGILLALHNFARRETKRQLRAFNMLGTLQVGFLLVMLASAAQRLLLYEQAFGLTHRRLYSHIFMAWLALLLLWLAVVLWRRPEEFFAGLLVCAAGFVLSLNLLNPDALIARVNVTRYGMTFVADGEGEPAGTPHVSRSDPYTPSRAVDAYFLTTLSDDAVPILLETLEQLPPGARENVAAELMARKERYEDDDSRWPSFHWSRWRAARMLSLWQEPVAP